jgi:hypothetical protein
VQARKVQEVHKILTCEIKKEGIVKSIIEIEIIKWERNEGKLSSQIETEGPEGVWAMTY